MSKHTLQTEIEIKFSFPGLAEGEQEVAYPKVEITYDYSPGRKAYTPRGEYAPIDPPEPPEINFVSATLINGDGLEPSMQQIQELASDWLDDKGFDEACSNAEASSGPDTD